ncbi:glutathione S-transferase family protein [Methylovirgula sp. 4M-Z18]|uniref:glutathione S-transferase family protein n=1 Tax=Methylovirgula sp. 4M-Z18 TaxID=2293567 RepID=UPI000E2F47E6|nr:glutathione S-transferase [Methylovirgula sp. 4M-Z18]RFB81423.1 glutathione S-transferase [Methylovirgula sp. 4M-Z18]
MTLRIYGYAGSINVRKVLWTCAELDLSFEREDWAGPFRSTAEPEFRALNPVGMVPVLDDEGSLIWESNTIIRYLAAKSGRCDLLPLAPLQRAHVEKWMDWQGSDFNNSWRIAFQGLVRGHPDYQDQRIIERAMTGFSAMVALIDGQLRETGAYICGPDFSLADIPIGLSVHRWRSMPIAKPHLTHIERYYERLCARAGFQQYGRDGGP